MSEKNNKKKYESKIDWNAIVDPIEKGDMTFYEVMETSGQKDVFMEKLSPVERAAVDNQMKDLSTIIDKLKENVLEIKGDPQKLQELLRALGGTFPNRPPENDSGK